MSRKIHQGFGQGYVCLDTETGSVQWHTFKSNRAASWNALCALERRAQLKQMGFVCVYLVVQWEGR